MYWKHKTANQVDTAIIKTWISNVFMEQRSYKILKPST